MAEISVNLFKAQKGISLPSNNSHTVVLTKITARILELKDIHFHFDSAVVLPEPRLDADDDNDNDSSFTIFRQCYLFARQYTDTSLLIAGHTDTKGNEEYNTTLSQLRAESVCHLLLGNSDKWVSIANRKHVVEDYQLILAWVHTVFGWDCDLEKIDNISGPLTKGALQRFQQRYKQDFGTVTTDGTISPDTWQAFFTLYMLRLKKIMKTDDVGMIRYRSAVRFLPNGPQTVGCGEYHPKASTTSDEKNEIDRRVELLFFKKDEEPVLGCHPDVKGCAKKKCLLYNPAFYTFEPIKEPDISETFEGALVVRLLYDGQPLENIVVRFFDGNSLLGEAATDTGGVAGVPACFEIGYYLCRIDGQPDIRIPTVSSESEPFDIVLPFEHPEYDCD